MIERMPRVETTEAQGYGLCLFVTDERGCVLIFKNNQNKESTQKVRGQLTTPAETIESDEKLIRDSLPRTITEEIGSIYGAAPKFRGVAVLSTPAKSIHLISLEIPTTRSAVHIDPKDKEEVSNPIWIPLEEITSDKTFRISQWTIPLFRAPIPEFATNILRARRGERFPLNQTVKANMPPGLYKFLEENPGPVYPVK